MKITKIFRKDSLLHVGLKQSNTSVRIYKHNQDWAVDNTPWFWSTYNKQFPISIDSLSLNDQQRILEFCLIYDAEL